VLRFLQEQQHGSEEGQGQQEESESSFVVETARQKARIDVNTEESQGDDSNSVLDERQRESEKDKQELFPGRAQKQVRG